MAWEFYRIFLSKEIEMGKIAFTCESEDGIGHVYADGKYVGAFWLKMIAELLQDLHPGQRVEIPSVPYVPKPVEVNNA